MKILIINGPNLNLLGIREPSVYGNLTLDDINEKITLEAKSLDMQVEFYQSNHEGDLIDKIQKCVCDGIVLNAGAYTHYSIALRDAISAVITPVIEVHLSNVHKREEFRHTSVLTPVCKGVVAGFGYRSYIMALHGFIS